jgi:ABC-type transport system substrate-binding protein
VDAEIYVRDFPTIQQLQARKEFAYMIAGGLSGNVPDPDSYLRQSYRTGGSRNYPNFSDPKVDAMIDKEGTIFDLNQRRAAVKEIVVHLIDNGVSTMPYGNFQLTGSTPQVQNLLPEGQLQGAQYETIWLDG